MGVKIGRAVCVLLIAAVIGFYCYEVFVMGVPYLENLWKTLVVVCAAVTAILRTGRGSRKRKGLKFYESAYEQFVKNAFKDDPSSRKKLLEGFRAYDENKLRKAESCAAKLKARCLSNADRESVYLLAGLAYTDMGLPRKAIAEYEELVARGIISAVIYNNLGQQYNRSGMRDKALDCFEAAVSCDSGYAVGYNNMAQLYFRDGELSAAEDIALKALEADSSCYQAATLLAIIYAINEDKASSERYGRMAIASGQNAADLKNAIAHYKSLYSEEEDA